MVDAVGVVAEDGRQLVGVVTQQVAQLGGHVDHVGRPVTVVPPDEARLADQLGAVAAVDRQRLAGVTRQRQRSRSAALLDRRPAAAAVVAAGGHGRRAAADRRRAGVLVATEPSWFVDVVVVVIVVDRRRRRCLLEQTTT